MVTNGDYWRAQAEKAGIPERTLAQVQEAIRLAKIEDGDEAMARLLLRHGRLTIEARIWLAQEYRQ